MPKEFLQNYNAEAHAIYLGKNRRLADPVFFPAPGPTAHMVETAQATLALEMEVEPDGPRDMIREIINGWGWGTCIRYPPGGPAPRLKDYEKAMNAMASDVHQTWHKIQVLVRNHEDAIQNWILDSYPRIDNEASRANNRLCAFILRSWHPTVADFNDCHPDIKMFMEPKSAESDFEICVPDFKSPRKFPFSFITQYFLKGHAVTGTPSDRDHYVAAYRHPSNFYDPRPFCPNRMVSLDVSSSDSVRAIVQNCGWDGLVGQTLDFPKLWTSTMIFGIEGSSMDHQKPGSYSKISESLIITSGISSVLSAMR
ncbi:hypothetical protein V8C42DRAFT_341752 [Trichoderma barbatum]